MGTVNNKRSKTVSQIKHEKVVETQSHLNYMGGPSYKIGHPVFNLRLAASSCFFGEPMYYQDSGTSTSKSVNRGRVLSSAAITRLRKQLNAIDPQEWRGYTPKQMLETAIDKALDFSVEATLQEAVRLRNEENIRTTPQVILVRAANHKGSKGTSLIRTYAPQIVKRADEPAVCVAYQLSAFGRPIPNSLKRALGDRLSSFSEYELAKYRMEDRSVKTIDVINLVHAKSTEALSKLVNGTLTNAGNTWEALRSAGKSWEDCVPVMGHMALLRNLRNFEQNKVDRDLYLSKLVSTAATGKQLPFRYYSAYKELEKVHANSRILDAVEECLEISLGNIPTFAGKSMSLCDNSGSAWGTTTSSMGTMHVAEIANLTAVLTAKNSDDGYVGVFGDRLETSSVRKKSSVFDTLKKLTKQGQSIGGGTEHGIWLFWEQAINQKEHWDNVFIYSDMQCGHGGLYGRGDAYKKYSMNGGYIDVPMLINEYRAKVNKDVNVFCVQIAGYQDTIVPEFYDKTYILGGWGDGLLKFAHSMINIPTQ